MLKNSHKEQKERLVGAQWGPKVLKNLSIIIDNIEICVDNYQ